MKPSVDQQYLAAIQTSANPLNELLTVLINYACAVATPWRDTAPGNNRFISFLTAA